MKSELYRYDKQTLSYKKVPKRYTFSPLRFMLKVIVFGLLVGTGIAAVFFIAYNSPEEIALRHRNKKLIAKLKQFNQELSESKKALKKLKQREEKFYGKFFKKQENLPEYQNNHNYLRNNPKPKEVKELVAITEQRLRNLEKAIDAHYSIIENFYKQYRKRRTRIMHTPSIPPLDRGQLKHPPHGYGPRIDPVYGTKAFHEGMDFTADKGTPVFATANGEITSARYNSGGYGKRIIIKHGYGYQTVYAHLSKILVRKEQKVSRGEKIGLIGNTGKSVAPHLHYEVRKDGKTVNPIYYFYDDLSSKEFRKLLKEANKSKISLD